MKVKLYTYKCSINVYIYNIYNNVYNYKTVWPIITPLTYICQALLCIIEPITYFTLVL